MAKQKVYALGIDLGGTKTLAAVVDVTTGEVISSERKRTRANKGQEYVSQHVINLSTAALESAKLPVGSKIIGVGIGAAGQIDRKNGVILDAPNLGVKDMRMADILGKQFGQPIAVGNDVEVAALGEYVYGAGRGYSTFVVIFVGTGIGGGIVHVVSLNPFIHGAEATAQYGLPLAGQIHESRAAAPVAVIVGVQTCG